MAAISLSIFAWAYGSHAVMLDINSNRTIIYLSMSILAVAAAVASYFWIPKSHRTSSALIAYILLGLSIGQLINMTGGTASPFVALWMAVAVFSGIFGLSVLLFLFGYATFELTVQFLTHHLTGPVFQGIILIEYLPLCISYILWHSKSNDQENQEHAYYDLANELNQVSNKAEAVINAIGDGVIAVNNSGIIDLINPAAQRITGWKREDALGADYHTVLVLLGHDNHELTQEKDPVFNVLSNNQQQRVNDLFLQTNSGKRISASIVASPIGRLGSGVIVVFRDITKELAEEHEQAEFISTASHEMRTPVASIEGYLGLALNPATSTIDDKARDFITKAHESAQHLGRLFQDLLDVSKADDGRLSNNPKVINVIAFAQGIIEDLQPKADAKKLIVFFKPSMATGSEDTALPSLAPVLYTHVDSDHFREILSNLIENAIKYTPQGEVVVDVNGDDSHIVVSIKDSGIGIPAEDIPHLFQKFYRVDNSDTREIGGTGLGLYLCRKLAEAMNGRIWVESEYKKGSTFFVEVPRISHEEANQLIESSVEDNDLKQKQEEGHHYLDQEEQPSTQNRIIKHTTPLPSQPTAPAPAPTPVVTPIAQTTPPVVTSPVIAPTQPPVAQQPIQPVPAATPSAQTPAPALPVVSVPAPPRESP